MDSVNENTGCNLEDWQQQCSRDDDTKIKLESTDIEPSIRVAVAGCSHGEMDKIYATLEELDRQSGKKTDLLLCCGDFQSVRNYGDLGHMHCPDKYKSIQTFYKYYNGEKLAPVLTIFVGGNHEASGYLSELPNGGWVAPKIYYMGFAGVLKFGGLRIGGLSGIFKAKDYKKGHYECPPYRNPTHMISAYHVRNIEVWRLNQLRLAENEGHKNALDIMISHDWPSGITDYGPVDRLLRIKPHFKEDIEKGQLGNPATMDTLVKLRPRYWFAAHMHAKFPALYPYSVDSEGRKAEPTRFLALDKPIPGRDFLQILDIPTCANPKLELEYDPEWIAILQNTDKFTSISSTVAYLPNCTSSDERWDFKPTKEEILAVEALGDLTVPLNFIRTAPPVVGDPGPFLKRSSLYYRNPQTATFCKKFGISNLNDMLADTVKDHLGTPSADVVSNADPSEIIIDDGEFGDEDFIVDRKPSILKTGTEEESTTSTTNFLDDFKPPSWKGSASGNSSTSTAFKRRKIELNEGEG